jgi:hypothetical protein
MACEKGSWLTRNVDKDLENKMWKAQVANYLKFNADFSWIETNSKHFKIIIHFKKIDFLNSFFLIVTHFGNVVHLVFLLSLNSEAKISWYCPNSNRSNGRIKILFKFTLPFSVSWTYHISALLFLTLMASVSF